VWGGVGSICGRCLGLTNLPPSCVDCLKIWGPQLTGIFRICSGLFTDCFTFYKLVRLCRKLQLSLIVKEFRFLQVNCYIHSSPRLVPVLTETNIDPTYHNISFFKSILTLSSQSRPGSHIVSYPTVYRP
jgi:hypothetical protein